MNIIGQPDVYEKPMSSWFDENLAKFTGNQPSVGELKIEWYTTEAAAEGCGEIVTIERWNGYVWEQHGLDAHMTLQDLFDLERTLV